MYNSLVAGNLIIAPPSLTSTNFAKSVIMLLGRQPTLGFVLNKPSNILISSIFQDIPASMDDNIFGADPKIQILYGYYTRRIGECTTQLI